MPPFRRILAVSGALLALALLVALLGRAPALAQAVETLFVKDADHPARQPFQASLSGRVTGSGYHPGTIAKVPQGKRLVIEYVSAWIVDHGSWGSCVLEVNTVQDGESVRHMVPVDQTGEVNNDRQFIAGRQVRLYADPGTEVRVAASRDGWTRAGAEISFSISGHLVNLE